MERPLTYASRAVERYLDTATEISFSRWVAAGENGTAADRGRQRAPSRFHPGHSQDRQPGLSLALRILLEDLRAGLSEESTSERIRSGWYRHARSARPPEGYRTRAALATTYSVISWRDRG
jgi:hypothetical protein